VTRVKLASGTREVVLRGLTGRDEKFLLQQKARDPARVVQDLLIACLDGVKSIDDWFLGDVYHALVALRIETYGSLYEFKFICGNDRCKSQSNAQVDLAKIPVTPIQKNVNPDSLEFKFADGKAAVMRLARGRDLNVISSMLQSPGSGLTQALILQTVRYDGKEPVPGIYDDYSLRELVTLRDFIRTNDCEIDTGIQLNCPKCGWNGLGQIRFTPDFFLPSETQRPT